MSKRQLLYTLDRTLLGHTGPLNCLRFSECGQYLASGGDDGHVLVWSLVTGDLLQRIRPKQGPIHAIEWVYPQSFDDLAIATAAFDGTVQLWRRRYGQFEFCCIYTAFEGPIESMAVDQVQNLIAVVGLGRVAVLHFELTATRASLNLSACDPPLSQPGRQALARSVVFCDSGRTLMVAYLDAKQINLWQVKPWKELWSAKLRSRIGNMAWSVTKRALLVANLIDGVDVYNVADRPLFERVLLVPQIRNNVPHQVGFAQEGHLIFSGSDRGEVHIWDSATGNCVQILRHGGIHCVQAVSDGVHLVASGSSDRYEVNPHIQVWSTINHSEPLMSTEPPPSKRFRWTSIIYLLLLGMAGVCLVVTRSKLSVFDIRAILI